MCRELLGIERYNISAVFLLFYFADDLVSEKNGETQTFFLWKRSENDDIIIEKDNIEIIFRKGEII